MPHRSVSMMRFWTRCTVVAVSVCLAVTAFPGKDLVLCIGPHGHIALEFAQNGRCDEGPCRPVCDAPKAPDVSNNDHVCGDCVSCVDIPLTQSPVTGPSSASDGAKKKSFSPAQSVLSAALPVQRAQESFRTPHRAYLSPPDNGGSSCLSSRILRI